MRFGLFIAVAAAFSLQAGAPAQAGLINAGSTVDVAFDYVSGGAQSSSSQIFNTAAPGPFLLSSLPAPPPVPITGFTAPAAPSPIHTDEVFNLTANAGFFFTNTQVIIYNNQSPPLPFCFSSSNTGSNCTDPYNTFDFKFTNEDITGVSVDPSSSADFAPATFGSHTGLKLVSPEEFTVDVTGADPAYLSTLIIDVSFAAVTPGVPEPSTWALMLLGFAGLGFAGYRRSRGARA